MPWTLGISISTSVAHDACHGVHYYANLVLHFSNTPPKDTVFIPNSELFYLPGLFTMTSGAESCTLVATLTKHHGLDRLLLSSQGKFLYSSQDLLTCLKDRGALAEIKSHVWLDNTLTAWNFKDYRFCFSARYYTSYNCLHLTDFTYSIHDDLHIIDSSYLRYTCAKIITFSMSKANVLLHLSI